MSIPERCRFRSPPLDVYVDAIRFRQPFMLARWSDGEWPCVLGEQGCNTDRHPYSPELRRDLTAALLDNPQYIMALQPFLTRIPRLTRDIHDWMERHDLRFDWVSGDTFHRASIEDRLAPFIDALNSRGVILVGPERLDALRLFTVVGRVYVPLDNCHRDVDRVIAETGDLMSRLGTDPVVSISASMSANVIVHRLHKRFPGHTAIDFGSVWEPYAGVACRRYHSEILTRLGK